MLQILSFIEIEQCANTVVQSSGPDSSGITLQRNKIFYLTFYEELEISKSIDDLTQTARIVIPKRFTGNVFKQFPDGTNRGISVDPNNGNLKIHSDLAKSILTVNTVDYTNLGNTFVRNADAINQSNTSESFIDPPLFNRGDMVTIYLGYLIDTPSLEGTKDSNPIKIYQSYRGYIASISSTESIELILEDYTWYFKQLRIQNKHYNTNPDLTGSNKKIPYTGLDSRVVKNTNRSYQIEKLPNGDSNPQSYSINTLQGVLLDCLNNTVNDVQLNSKGIFPLIWKEDFPKKAGKDDTSKGKVPKPVIVLADQAIRSAGNINIMNNATVYTLLETIKNSFNMNTYFLQQSPAYNMSIVSNSNLPSHTLWGDVSNAGYPGNYLNLGFSQYVPNTVYQPQSYTFYLNGSNGNVIASNLCFKRQGDFVMGAIIKSTQMANAKDNDTQITTSFGSKSKKIRGSNVIVGDQGGSMVTYYYSNHIDFDPGTGFLTGYNPSGGKLSKGSLYDMAKFGYERLNSIHYTGSQGSIVTFGIPFVNIGDVVKIIDPLYPERDGYYKVRKVINRSNIQRGLEQEIFLHYQVQLNSTNNQYEILQTNSNTDVFYNNIKYSI